MLEPEHRRQLLRVARASIQYGLEHGRAPALEPGCDPVLSTPAASFVTLHREGALRGCIGHLEACRPLLDDVNENAFSAAFRDPRFPPVDATELHDLDLHISVLSPLEPVPAEDPDVLMGHLTPGVHGLVLEAGRRHATFLPSVWDTLREPELFLAQLLRKGGWPADTWPGDLRASRYTVEEFA